MSKKNADVEVKHAVLVRVALPLGNEVAYRLIGRVGGEPFASINEDGDLRIAGMTADTTALVATFPKKEWVGCEVEGDAEMLADD